MFEVVKWPDPILKKVASEVTEFDSGELGELTQNMTRVMCAKGAIGLAAPQIGISKRIFVMLKPGNPGVVPVVFINPKIIGATGGIQTSIEGCLSFPNVTVSVSRAKNIIVSYFDIFGKGSLTDLQNLSSICFQHELDHLDGKTFLDYVSPFKRTILERKMGL